MHEEMINDKQETKEDQVKITYYFTVFFILIGTVATLLLMKQTVQSLSLFAVLLSVWGGGLPIGIIGALIDYKVSRYKLKEVEILNHEKQ